MSRYEIKFDAAGAPLRVRSLRAAAKLAQGRPFVARKLLRKKRKGPWAKYKCTGNLVRSVARQKKQ